MQLNELRKELRFNTELVQLIGTLKNIAAGQYHLMEKEKRRFEAFMTAFASFFRVVDLVSVEHPLVRETVDALGIVVVTSDSGFMGGLNQGVIRAALRCQGALSNQKTELIVIGEKGGGVVSDLGRDFKYFRGIDQSTLYEQSVEVRDYVVSEVLARRLGRVVVVYPRPVSFTAQAIETVSLLPCSQLFDRDADSEVSRRTGDRAFLAEALNVIVESSFTALVEYLASLWVASKLFQVFEDSKLAEFSARAMHLEESLQKIETTRKRIQHLVFKATHERIDKGMRESFAAGRTRRRRNLVSA